MNKVFQQVSLKVVAQDNEGTYRIENIDSRLVSRFNSVLNTFYGTQKDYDLLGYRQYDYRSSNRRGDVSPEIVPFFRGFRPFFQNDVEVTEKDKADYFRMFFSVGEKGMAYREDITTEGINPYFGEEPIEDDISRLLDFTNSNLKRLGFGKLEMEKLNSHFGDDLTKSYMFLLNLVHNIGGRWENKCRSPFVSASYGANGYKTALHFSTNRNHFRFSYIIFGFIRKDNSDNYFFTKELYNNLKILNVGWYDDIHSEIILKDGIFPHNIFGVFEVDNETGEQNFIINPYLYQLFNLNKNKRNYGYNNLVNNIIKNGIPVKQSHFSEFAILLGYQSYGYRLADGYVTAGRIGDAPDIDLLLEP